eukprot:scaffold52335_cov61-Phaeocystis_antarctica.AAC.1
MRSRGTRMSACRSSRSSPACLISGLRATHSPCGLGVGLESRVRVRPNPNPNPNPNPDPNPNPNPNQMRLAFHVDQRLRHRPWGGQVLATVPSLPPALRSGCGGARAP